MSEPERLAQAAATFIDLEKVPFTLPGSRLLVRSGPSGGLGVSRAEYEVDPDECTAVSSLQVLDATGEPLPVSRVRVDRIEFGDGAAGLTFAGPDQLSVGGADGTRLRLALPGGRFEQRLGAGSSALLSVDADLGVRVQPDGDHARWLAGTAGTWLDWFGRCPLVPCDLQVTAAHCWWVLGANTVELASAPGSRAVVPSKLGYLGLWQWDAYFIAIGLRHGDPELAAEQLELALAFPTPAGQLPDVLHDHGVLASSADLPPADLDRLRETASPAADLAAPVPLTKPPLAALALVRLAESGLPTQAVTRLLPVVQRSQQWWFAEAFGADGLPEYPHPYSSGLDDSPVFDSDLPVATPDLAAYLVFQDRLLGDLLEGMGRLRAAADHRGRANATRERLLQLWDPAARRFRSRGRTGPVAAHAVVDLLPLLVGDLPGEVTKALLADLQDPARFGAPFPVPTVAMDDPSFSGSRMWRGPSWVNMNWLLVEGLRRSGRRKRALELTRRTLELVAAGGGAYEYFDPITGHPPERAVPMFSWTAALFIDLAVQLAELDHLPEN